MVSGHGKCRVKRPDASMDTPARAREISSFWPWLPAVIYPVSLDLDGFREAGPNHGALFDERCVRRV